MMWGVDKIVEETWPRPPTHSRITVRAQVLLSATTQVKLCGDGPWDCQPIRDADWPERRKDQLRIMVDDKERLEEIVKRLPDMIANWLADQGIDAKVQHSECGLTHYQGRRQAAPVLAIETEAAFDADEMEARRRVAGADIDYPVL